MLYTDCFLVLSEGDGTVRRGRPRTDVQVEQLVYFLG